MRKNKKKKVAEVSIDSILKRLSKENQKNLKAHHVWGGMPVFYRDPNRPFTPPPP